MNVLFLHSSSDLYGASRILIYIVKACSASGIKSHVCLPEPGPLVAELEKAGAIVFVRDIGIIRRSYFNISGLINRVYVLFKSYFYLKSYIKKHNISLVYANTTAVLVGCLLRQLSGIRLIWHVHEIILTPKFLAKFLAYAMNKFADHTIVVSQPVKEHWDSIYKGKSRVAVLHNGIDISHFVNGNRTKIRQEIGLDEQTLIVGMIGRVSLWKGQPYFLNIAKLINEKYPDVRFLMAGDAFAGYEYLYEELSQLKSQLKLTDFVIDLGYRTDVADYLSALDVFILPSILPDPLPTVVLETMASAKPVIATAHGGALEMVDNGITGYWIPWDNANQAFEIIEPLLKNEQLRAEMAQKGFERVNKLFSLERFQTDIVTLIKKVARNDI